MQRAFHVSGSRAVMASLWQIPDKATQTLMLRFYENLWRKKLSKLEALRETPQSQALLMPGGLWFGIHAVPLLEAEFGRPVRDRV